jgi:hypothetical protein
VRNADKALSRKPERSRPLGRLNCICKGAIKIDLKENNLGRFLLGLFALGYRAMMSMFDHSNEPLGTVTNYMELSS